MIGLCTAAEVRAAEAPLLEALPAGALMQRAATGLATVCLRLLGSPYGRRVVLLVGSGNNGGDGHPRAVGREPGERGSGRPEPTAATDSEHPVENEVGPAHYGRDVVRTRPEHPPAGAP